VKRIRIVVAGALFAALVPVGSASAAPVPCSGYAKQVMRHGLEQVQVKTLNLEVSPVKESYEIGDVAKFQANVTRPAKEDPLGQGIPMDRPYVTPAEGVFIGVGLMFKGGVFLPGFGVTDANGDAVMKVKIQKYVKPGTVHASFFAWKTMADAPCARIDETAYLPVPDIFSVRRSGF
jgi:hypothetical protein